MKKNKKKKKRLFFYKYFNKRHIYKRYLFYINKKLKIYSLFKFNLVYLNKILKNMFNLNNLEWNFIITKKRSKISVENVGNLIKRNLSLNYSNFKNIYKYLWTRINNDVKYIDKKKIKNIKIRKKILLNIKNYLFYFQKINLKIINKKDSIIYNRIFNMNIEWYLQKYFLYENNFLINFNFYNKIINLKINKLVIKRILTNKLYSLFGKKNQNLISFFNYKMESQKKIVLFHRNFKYLLSNFNLLKYYLHNYLIFNKFYKGLMYYTKKHITTELIFNYYLKHSNVLIGYKIVGTGRLGRVSSSGRAFKRVYKKGKTSLNNFNQKVDLSMINQITRNGVFAVSIFKFYKKFY